MLPLDRYSVTHWPDGTPFGQDQTSARARVTPSAVDQAAKIITEAVESLVVEDARRAVACECNTCRVRARATLAWSVAILS